jgi:catechol 2,3-dioxygenase-like lactoylglutathione lyase family enzyme
MNHRQIALRTLALAAALLTVAPAYAAERASLLRTTLMVRDVDRAIAFYSRLGFAQEGEMGGPRSPESPFPINSKSSRYRLVIMGSGAGGKIGLLSFDDASPAPTRAVERERIGLGDMVFVMDVPDAAAVHATLTAAGAKIVEPPQVFKSSKTDAQGKPLEGRVFHVFDPDGYLIEILQAPE